MNREHYERALERLEEINPKEEDRDAVLTCLIVDEVRDGITVTQEPVETETVQTSGWTEELASHWSMSPERIEDVLTVEPDDEEILIMHQSQGNNAEAQRELAKVYLTIKRLCLNEKRCSSMELGKFMAEQGVNDGHVGENISRDDAILKSGVGPSTKYGITPAGMKEAGDIVKSWSE